MAKKDRREDHNEKGCYCNGDGWDNCSPNSEKDAAMMMNAMIIFGGPAVGFSTNPKTEKEDCFIEINGEKIVCIAQGGECRYNHRFYSPGLNDRKSWTTPVVDEDCPDRCCYKVLVCDNHDAKCEGSVTYYPHYNKFRGQFVRYCRNLDKFVNEKVGDNGNSGKVGKDNENTDGKIVRKISKRDIKIGMTGEKGKDGEVVINQYY
jgi:hypothetical protein